MRITFSQLYDEVGASFDRLDAPLLRQLREALDGLDIEVPLFVKKMGANDFKLGFILSAQSGVNETRIVGPNVRKRTKEIEFSLFLPWCKTATFVEEIRHVLPHISSGIISVLDRYGVAPTGVAEVIENVLCRACADPRSFRYPNRSAEDDGV